MRESSILALAYLEMGAPSSTWLVAGIVLMGLFECDPHEWGAHAGKLCAGEELNLGSIASGRSLVGWWSYVPPQQKASPPLGHRFLFIDVGLRPRVWSKTGGAEYERSGGQDRDWTFGCASFIDHPLVVGAETRAPGGARTTIGTGCSTAWWRGDPGSRRVLDSVYLNDGLLCLVYDFWRFTGRAVRNRASGDALRRTVCFGYDSAADQMLVAYRKADEPLVKHRYQRYQGDQSTPRGENNAEFRRGDDETGGR